MDRSGIDNILEQLQATSALASGVKKPAEDNEAVKVEFGETLKAAIDKVNDAQQTAGELSRGFVSGESDTDLHEVMISLQRIH